VAAVHKILSNPNGTIHSTANWLGARSNSIKKYFSNFFSCAGRPSSRYNDFRTFLSPHFQGRDGFVQKIEVAKQLTFSGGWA
jgi:hypothetical protein